VADGPAKDDLVGILEREAIIGVVKNNLYKGIDSG